MQKETMKMIDKVWGRELWIVNCDKYCGKLLMLVKGCTSSYHYHKKKQETFFCTNGEVALTIDGKDYMLSPFSRPKTIMPNQKHKFYAITNATILEISTEHDDKDVFRLEESECATSADLKED